MSILDGFEHLETCPLCGEPLIFKVALTTAPPGRLVAVIDMRPLLEHPCPQRTKPYVGILAALDGEETPE